MVTIYMTYMHLKINIYKAFTSINYIWTAEYYIHQNDQSMLKCLWKYYIDVNYKIKTAFPYWYIPFRSLDFSAVT